MDIFISAWSFEKHMRQGQLSLDELPELAISNGFAGIEVMDRQLQLSDTDYIRRFAKLLKRVKCGIVLDISSDLTYENEDNWLEQIDYVRQSLECAKILGAQKVRLLLGGQAWSFQKLYNLLRKRKQTVGFRHDKGVIHKIAGSQLAGKFGNLIRRQRTGYVRHADQKLERAILALEEIVPEAERLDVMLVIENHWGISCRPENILKVVERLDSEYLGTCPDFDNFPKDIDRYQGLEMLARRALHVHAKSRRFSANGEEKQIDYSRCMAILHSAGYQGGITIEYEGRADALRGSMITGNLILRHWKRASNSKTPVRLRKREST